MRGIVGEGDVVGDDVAFGKDVGDFSVADGGRKVEAGGFEDGVVDENLETDGACVGGDAAADVSVADYTEFEA